MNTNSNSYTFIYASVMVVLVAAALAFTNGALKEKQGKNVEVDKMQQILRSLKIEADYNQTDALYKETVTKAYLVNSKGQVVNTSTSVAFNTDVAKEVAKPMEKRSLPVYEAVIKGEVKYILPVYGAGLWGPIWGYVALNSDKNTVYAASFSHQGETPGLGAEISTNKFQMQFEGKHLMRDSVFVSVAVVKPGKHAEGMDQVDGISGGTITSQGVHKMLMDCLGAYESFLKVQSHENK
jgi:Na+-transporting NADH:ubiquinone oxidoreductase subunit C